MCVDVLVRRCVRAHANRCNRVCAKLCRCALTCLVQRRQGKSDRVRGRRDVALTDDLALDPLFFFGSLCIEQ